MIQIRDVKYPERCEECPFYSRLVGACEVTGNFTLRHKGMEKPEWCPVESVETKTKDDAFHDGQWSMFKMISTAWFGKQCYCDEENGVYSRYTGKHFRFRRDAVREFMNALSGDEFDHTVGEDVVDR